MTNAPVGTPGVRIGRRLGGPTERVSKSPSGGRVVDDSEYFQPGIKHCHTRG
jgi:hypothetical protein